MPGRSALAAASLLAMLAAWTSGQAQTAPDPIAPAPVPLIPPGSLAIKRIVVSATRTRQSSFDVPVSIYSVSGREVSEANEQENLSESLNRVPGIDVQNRQDYAEGVRITSRGFGSQTSFGTRNVKILIDGVPATEPDGTGDSEIINLGDVSRIEVLSGPFSVLYGNAAGGVIQVFSKDGPPRPTVSFGLLGGSYGSYRASLSYGGTAKLGADGSFNYMMNASDFFSGGYRDHSAARRQQFYGKYRIQVDPDTSYTVLIDALNEPDSLDPGGLTAAQYHQNPRQAGTGADTFNTRKTLRHTQVGLVYRHQSGDHDTIEVTLYAGNHSVLQYLPFTGSFTASGGGVVDLERKFGGIGGRWTHKLGILGVPVTTIVGADFDYEDQHRKGYVNDDGVIGALRRNEQDIARNISEYAEINADLTPKILLDAGIQHSQEYFNVRDLYITPSLTDDSGSITYSHTNLVAGTTYHLTPVTNLFADYGEGFETPTLDQLAYLPNGDAGLNSALVPTTSENYEAGIKTLIGQNSYLQIAAFHIHTNNQILVSSSTDGRTAYANEGQTGRNGVDASIESTLPRHVQLYASYTLLAAHFEDSPFAGNALPGVPRQRVYGEADWQNAPSGFYTKLNGQWQTRQYVDSQNSAYAAGYFTADWAAGFRQTAGPLGLNEFLRVNNILNRTYIGAVVIGATNGEYYEPAEGRNFIVGMTANYRF